MLTEHDSGSGAPLADAAVAPALVASPKDAGRDEASARRLSARKAKRVAELAERGLTIREVAAKLGVSKSTIHRQFGSLFRAFSGGRTAAYRERRVPLLEATEARLLGAVWDDARLEKASLRDVAISYGVFFDKRRLETGQSTQNLALHQLVEQVERERMAASKPPALDG